MPPDLIAFFKSILPESELVVQNNSVFVPSKNFLFEFNGLLDQSAFNPLHQKNSHLNKYKECFDKNVTLFGIFEDEWEPKKELIKNMILHRLAMSNGTPLYARKLELRKLEKNVEFKDFFKRNHLDGHTNAKWAFGLFYKNKLVMCASVRTNHQSEVEIARLATDFNYRVVGGGGRLIKAIKEEINGKSLITFSNNRLSKGNTYQKLNFTQLSINSPSYYYTDGTVRVWRFKCKRLNDPVIITQYPTERAQARGGVFSEKHLGHSKPLYETYDYGHTKWKL